MSDKGDGTPLGLKWPDAYADLLPVVRQDWGVEGNIFLTRQLGGGKSGALVFFVDISTKDFNGQAILKLDRAFDPSDQERHEAALHARAIEDAPDFAAAHLSRLLHSAHHGSQIAVLSAIAGRGLEYVEPWVDCAYDRKLESIRKVSTDLLEKWNADYRLSPDLKMPQELLRSWLGYRKDPLEGGRIHGFLTDDCGISPDVRAITHDGHWYPNPLAFMEAASGVPKRVRLRCAVGRGHGDLHGLNLLVGRREKKALEYYLIDLAWYESEQFLFYDHAYFEIASLLISRANASARDWAAIVAKLRRFQPKDKSPELRADDVGSIELVQALRKRVSRWIERNEADRLSFMENQVLLARVAAGLAFSHKQMSVETRQMAFFYAAANLKDYLELNRLEWQKAGPAFEIGGGSQGTPGEETPVESSGAPIEGSVDPIVLPPVTGAPSYTPAGNPTASRRQLWLRYGAITAVAAIALVVALTGLDIRLAHENTAPGSQFETLGPVDTAEAAASLAVLPFKNLSAEEDDGFTDGLSIDIASVFERTGVFKMPSMTSTFRFKGRGENSRAIGQALNVDYLLEGTVLRAGDNLTVAASLVRAEDGFLIWSQTYRQTLGEVFEVQEAIAKAIGEALATPLTIDSDILKAERTDDPQAYELYVRGQALLEQRGLALQDAMAVLERAVEIKPDFAAAWGALSLVYNVIPSFVTEINGRPVNAVIFYRRAKEAALTAQRIDPDLPVVRHALGSLYLRERQWAGAQDALEAALRNDPYAHRVMLTYGALLYTVGKRNEARAFIDQAREIDPLNELYNLWAAFMRWQDDQTEETIEPIEDIFQRLPQYRELALRMIIDHRARTGELEKARALIEGCLACSEALRARALGMLDAATVEPAGALFEAYKDSNILGFQYLYALGGAEVTLDAFRYYGVNATRRLFFFTVPWPLADALSRDKRFIEIAKDMGLVSYWRTHGPPDNCLLTNHEDFVCEPGA